MIRMTTAASLVLTLLLGLLVGMATIAGAQDDSPSEEPSEGVSEPDDTPTEGGSATVVGDRLSGADRISTAVAISQYEFPEGAEEVYLARADNFADAVAAGALQRGPVLLVPQCETLPDVVVVEIGRLAPRRVVALGGTAAICDDVLTQAVAAADGPSDDPTDGPSDDPTDGPGDDPTDGPSDDPTDGPTEDADGSTQLVDMAVGEERTFDAAEAGTVGIRRTTTGVEQVSATPAAGWSIRDSTPADVGQVEVSFTDGVTRVDFDAEVEDGGQVRIRVETRPE